MPKELPPKIYFRNHVPPVLPESTVFEFSSEDSKHIQYFYEGLYHLKVRLTTSGGGSVKISASDNPARWMARNKPRVVFNSKIDPMEKTYEFIHRLNYNYSFDTRFRIQESGGAMVKRVELIPIPREK